MDDHFDTSGVFEISKFDISKFACIFDAKTDSFIPFGANFCVYLKHTGIQKIEKMTGKIVS